MKTDVDMQEMGSDRKNTRLALIDVDGTLTKAKSIWQHLMETTGCWDGAGEENLRRFLAKEISYEEFCDLDAKLFAGYSYAELREIAWSVPMRKGVDALFMHLTSAGYRIALVSTGLRLLTDYFTERFDIATCVVNDLAVQDGICSGTAIMHIGDDQKGHFAKKLIAEHNASYVVAIGDSKGDLPMFAEADLGIAVASTDPHIVEATQVQVSGEDMTELCAVL